MKSLNIQNFDTTSVTSMQHMFQNCSSLTSINLNQFVTDNVLQMNYMFNGCTSLTELNLYSFNTLNCYDFSSMWTGIREIKLILKNSTTYNLIEKLPSDIKFDLDLRN